MQHNEFVEAEEREQNIMKGLLKSVQSALVLAEQGALDKEELTAKVLLLNKACHVLKDINVRQASRNKGARAVIARQNKILDDILEVGNLAERRASERLQIVEKKIEEYVRLSVSIIASQRKAA